MDWNKEIRQSRRRLSLAFAVIASLVAVGHEKSRRS